MIKIFAWNINGETISKLQDPEIQKEMMKADIIILFETKLRQNQKVILPASLQGQFRSTNFQRKGQGGGIICLTNKEREEIETPTSRIRGTVEIIIKTTVEATKRQQTDLKIWGAYCQPEGTHQAAAQEERKDIAQNLGKEIRKDEYRYHQRLVGDTNAIIGNATDDKIETDDKEENWSKMTRENNPDKGTNQNGPKTYYR